MLIEKENWDISSGIGGHQCVLDPRVLSAESVKPCKVGLCLVILSRFMRPGRCAALPRAGVLKMVPGTEANSPAYMKELQPAWAKKTWRNPASGEQHA